MVGRLNLYVLSFQFLLLHKDAKHRIYELCCLCLFWYCFLFTIRSSSLTSPFIPRFWFVLLLSQVGSCAQIVSFVLISHALTFILHIQINLSHYSMEIVNSFKNIEPFVLQVCSTKSPPPILVTSALYSNYGQLKISSARLGWTGSTEGCSSKPFITYFLDFQDIIYAAYKEK